MKKINWQSVIDAVAAIYKALFSGKKVGGVTLPEQGHVPPLRGSKFDSAPHEFETPDATRRQR